MESRQATKKVYEITTQELKEALNIKEEVSFVSHNFSTDVIEITVKEEQ